MIHLFNGSLKIISAACVLAAACTTATVSSIETAKAPPGEKFMNEEVKDVKDITLACSAKVSEKSLDLSYELTNRSGREIYALELIPTVKPGTQEPAKDFNVMHVNVRESGALYVLKGIPPPPPNKRIMHYVIPVASKLEPGAVLKRTVSMPIPLREQNPYYLPLDIKEADEAKVNRIVFSMHIVRDTLEGFRVEPTELGPDLFFVRAKHLLVEREEVSCGVELKDMQVFKYKETFPRL